MPVPLALVVALALAACSSDSISSAYLQANNAELRQGASVTAQPMQFIIEPGTVISIGTPARTELVRSLPTFRKPVDTIGMAVEKIGELVNPGVAEA